MIIGSIHFGSVHMYVNPLVNLLPMYQKRISFGKSRQASSSMQNSIVT